jgi:peptidyl-prolyl cis-trans isomerase SurA
MRNTLFLPALGLALLSVIAIPPVSAQDQPAPAPAPQSQDADKKPDAPAPAQQPAPSLEKPGTATETEETAKPAAKTPPKKSTSAATAGAKAGTTKEGEKIPEGTNSKTVEEIIARVNNEIVTRSDLDKKKETAQEEVEEDCRGGKCSPEEQKQRIEDAQKNALKELIDQSLLVQRGKDMGLNVETDVIKRLDSIRVQNNLSSMEDLEKAVTSHGLNWEDFKDNLRKSILTQKVISQEVGSHVNISKEDVKKYYDEHKAEFIRPEQVALREIEVSTEKKKDSELPDLKKKAETALKRVKDGEDFGEIAKRFSDGSTAKQGGFLGVYKRGELSKELEDTVFKMKKNDLTDVLDTKQGYLVLQVLEHYDEGEQALSKVESEIMDKMYSTRMEPKLKDYLKTLREQSYVVIKPGYEDIAGGGNSEIQEVSATPEANKAKKGRKKFVLFGKRAATASGD